MSRGARNLHRLAGAQEKRRQQALDGPCTFCSQPSIAFVEDWSGKPSGVCQQHAEQGERLGYTVHHGPDGGAA